MLLFFLFFPSTSTATKPPPQHQTKSSIFPSPIAFSLLAKHRKPFSQPHHRHTPAHTITSSRHHCTIADTKNAMIKLTSTEILQRAASV